MINIVFEGAPGAGKTTIINEVVKKLKSFGIKVEMMVYVIMGFLEAGKTSLIRDLLTDDMFDDKAKTLILACEEGEEEYESAMLEKTKAACEYIEDEESFNGKVVEKFLKKHRPDRIIIEYNGMWPTKHIPEMYDELEEICFDREVIFQTIDVANDETFQMYMKNMPSMMVDQFRMAEMIIINRCTLQTNKNAIRGSIKAVNPRAQIVYESEDDAFYEMKDEMPFDINADIIDISEDDFGIWYIDMQEHPERYKGKIVEFVAKVMKPKAFPSKVFYPGRMAMTCCADDTSFLGYVCRSAYEPKLNAGDWVKIRAKVRYANLSVYGGEGPVLEAENIEPAEPIEELVYFN